MVPVGGAADDARVGPGIDKLSYNGAEGEDQTPHRTDAQHPTPF